MLSNNHRFRKPFRLLFIIALLLAAGCRAAVAPETDVELVLPTAPAVEGETAVESAPAATATTAPTLAPAATATPFPTPTAVPTTAPTPQPVYQVAFVTPDDTLNVRAGPGVENEIVGELAPDAAGVTLTGERVMVQGSTWVEISAPTVNGWVNSQFLTQVREADQFCTNPEVLALLDSFQNVIASQNGDGLAQLVHSERGLRVHRYWRSPEVRFRGEEVNSFFVDQTAYEWGIQDGSGLPIVGPVAEVLGPLFERDIVDATEVRCNDVFAEEWVRLPEGYEQLNSFSFYQPGTDEFAGLDWGKWVVGIDWWDGRPVISYLVHFEWEI